MVAFNKSTLYFALLAFVVCLFSGVQAAPAVAPTDTLEERLSEIGFQACPTGPQISLKPVEFINLEFAQLFVQNDPNPGALYTWTLDLIRPVGSLIVSPTGRVSLNGTLPAPAVLAFTVTATPITVGEIRTDSFSIEIK